jgi:hypothetical protein
MQNNAFDCPGVPGDFPRSLWGNDHIGTQVGMGGAAWERPIDGTRQDGFPRGQEYKINKTFRIADISPWRVYT